MLSVYANSRLWCPRALPLCMKIHIYMVGGCMHMRFGALARSYVVVVMVALVNFSLLSTKVIVSMRSRISICRPQAMRRYSTGSSNPTVSSLNKRNADNDTRYMKLALRHAQHAYREKEVPIGAVVVDSDGNILATGRNQVEECHDATAHAELNALKQAAQYKNNWRLLNCTLYTTVEPCMMCFGAMQAFRISRVVYAAKDIRLGVCGSWQSLHNVKHPIHHVVDVSGGVCEEESSMLLRRFFSSLRTEKFRYPGYDVGRGVCDSDIDTELTRIESEQKPPQN